MKKTAFFLGAHSDDVEIGAGGLILDLVERSWQVLLYVAGTGNVDSNARQRHAEQTQAAKLLGANLIWGDLSDSNTWTEPFYISQMGSLLGHYQPHWIFTHWPKDTHQDHRRLSEAVMASCRHGGDLFFYEGPSSYAFDPCVFHDCTKQHRKKLDALEAHESQALKLVRFVIATSQRRAIEARRGYHAEAFIPWRTQLLSLLEGG